MILRPVNFTSASIAFHRSVLNSSVGRAFDEGCFSVSPGLFLLTFESAPMIGARSENCSRFDTSSPESKGRGLRPTNVSEPFRSLPPTRPVKFSYRKTLPSALNWPTSRPSVAYGGVAGSVTPTIGYKCSRLTPCSQSRKSSAARWAGSVTVPTKAICVSPIRTSSCTGNGRIASCNASTPPTLPSPDTATLLYLPFTDQPMPYGGTGGFGPSFVVILVFAETLAGFGALALAAAAADAADAAAASDAAALSTCWFSLVAPLLPTIWADDFCDAASCCFITSPMGIIWPSVFTATCISAFVISSAYAILPWLSAMSCS